MSHVGVDGEGGCWISRRTMLGAAAAGGLLGILGRGRPAVAASEAGVVTTAPASVVASAPAGIEPSRVALVNGDSRPAIVLEALKRIEPEIRRGLVAKKRVLIKPNVVSITNQLSATHADCLEGILDFLSPLVRGEIVIAESSASGPAATGFDNFGYLRLQKKYGARFVDMDLEPFTTRYISDQHYRPQAVRFSQMLLDPETYIISTAPMKTHDRAVVTLSLKNVTVGGIVKDPGFRWGHGSRGRNDKALVHGGKANEAIHFNLFSLAQLVRPDLSVIDGFTGCEGNGPVFGTPVDHRVVVASTDWLAAERLAVELMGFDFAKVGYLTFCAAAGMGQADLSRLEILGGKPADLARKYRPHDNIEQQYKWMIDS